MEQLTGLKLETDSLEIPRLPDVDRERELPGCATGN